MLEFRDPGPTELAIFVGHSNGIERLEDPPYGPGTPEFDDHFEAARRVAAGVLDNPLDIHLVLALRILPGEAGRIRKRQVTVGGSLPPAPGPHLAAHMRRLARMTAAGPADGEPAAVHAWTIHDEFECAHPFTDGNGRTGRLLLNAVRRRYGLSWRVVCDGDAERRSYFANIRDYRAHRFVCRPAGADFSGCE